MRKRIIAVVLVLICIVILSIIIIYFGDDRRGAIKTIYVSDTSLFDHRIIWDKNGKLVSPEALKKILRRDSIREIESDLNGPVVYEYAKKDFTYRKKQVFKLEYSKEDFYIIVNNDTLSMEDSFIAEVGVNHEAIKNYTITIFNSEVYAVEKHASAKSSQFRYKTKKFSPGINTFKGVIKVDNKKYDFQFNYFIKSDL